MTNLRVTLQIMGNHLYLAYRNPENGSIRMIFEKSLLYKNTFVDGCFIFYLVLPKYHFFI